MATKPVKRRADKGTKRIAPVLSIERIVGGVVKMLRIFTSPVCQD
jgi:hypothetical protein